MLLATALLAAATAPATAASPPPADVVVTGERLTQEEAERRAAAYVEAAGIAAAERPAARWTDPVCPSVRGIADAYAKIVETRVRAAAAGAGVRLARSGCRPNLVIAFGFDGDALVEAIEQRNPRRAIEEVNGDQAGRNAGQPIRWMYRTETQSADGMPSTGTVAPIFVGGGPNAGPPLPSNGESPTTLSYRPTLIGMSAIRALRHAVVVVDLKRAEGVPLNAVADFAAYVGLAEVRRGTPPPPGSILALFDGGPDALTRDDATMLRALYAMPLDRPARRQRGMLVKAMVAERDTARD